MVSNYRYFIIALSYTNRALLTTEKGYLLIFHQTYYHIVLPKYLAHNYIYTTIISILY